MLRNVVVLISELMLPIESVSMWSLDDRAGTLDGNPANTASDEVDILDMDELD
jgi:hypothetical protein